MVKIFAICGLCIISAAMGAGIDHHYGPTIQQALLELIGSHHLQTPVGPKAAVAATPSMNAEVLGDRVRCDVRYQELKIPPSEYQAFKRKCMGDKYSGSD
jgi:hypothetical protein